LSFCCSGCYQFNAVVSGIAKGMQFEVIYPYNAATDFTISMCRNPTIGA